MKKLILILSIAIFSMSCVKPKHIHDIKEVYVNYLPDGVSLIEIDGCEYLRSQTFNFHYVYTHKGNCKYCIERNKQ